MGEVQNVLLASFKWFDFWSRLYCIHDSPHVREYSIQSKFDIFVENLHERIKNTNGTVWKESQMKNETKLMWNCTQPITHTSIHAQSARNAQKKIEMTSLNGRESRKRERTRLNFKSVKQISQAFDVKQIDSKHYIFSFCCCCYCWCCCWRKKEQKEHYKSIALYIFCWLLVGFIGHQVSSA